MVQATGWNSLERTASDWRRLFASISPEYHFLGTKTPQGSAVSLIEGRFETLNAEKVAEADPISSQPMNELRPDGIAVAVL